MKRQVIVLFVVLGMSIYTANTQEDDYDYYDETDSPPTATSATARRLLVVKCSAADQQQAATAPSIDNSFVLPASQPTPSVIRDMVGNQFP